MTKKAETCAGEKRTVSDTGQIEFRGVPVSVGSALIAANDTMRATDTQRPTMRFSAVKTEEQAGPEERREPGSPCGPGSVARRRKGCVGSHERRIDGGS